MPRPIVVTAELRGPYIDNGQPIHLDSLLALVWARRHPRFAHRVHRADPSASIEAPHLPLVRAYFDGAAVWAASGHIEVEPSTPAAIWQTRRRDVMDWSWYARPGDVATGPTKDCLIRREARASHALRWLAWGSVSEVRKSLRALWGRETDPHGFVGAVRRAGAGEVARWSVEAGSHPLESCYVLDGRAARHLPASWVASAERWRSGAWAQPYRLDEHRESVPAIGTRVELHPGACAELHEMQARHLEELRIGGAAVELAPC